LSQGKVIRGRIGLQMTAVPREDFRDFGLKSRAGALVSSVAPDGPAEKAGLKAGDVVIEYNGRPITDTTELQKMVSATKPGTSVPVKVVRNTREQTLTVTVAELDLDAERGGRQSRNNDRQQPPEEQGQDSFGLTLSNVSPQMARRLQLPSGLSGAIVTAVDPDGPSAGALRQGDVILAVNGQEIETAAAAGREFQRIASGRIARVLVWRDGGEVFVTVKKE
jgi:serine protease Do